MRSDSSAAADADRHSTDVRFSVRTMLFVTIPVALIAAVTGCFLRSIAPEARARVAIGWTTWSAILIACIVVAAVRRIRFEKLAGRSIMRLPIYGGNPNWRLLNRFMLSESLVLFGGLGLFWTAQSSINANTIGGAVWQVFNLGSLVLAGATAFSVTLWWWGRDIRLCERGVLWDRRIIAWCEVHERWDPDHDALTLSGLDQRENRLVCDVLVPEPRREAVVSLLRSKIRRLEKSVISTGVPDRTEKHEPNSNRREVPADNRSE